MASPSDAGGKSTEDVIHCPACGRKLRGDLGALRAGGSDVRATCPGCGRPLVATLADGAVVVKLGAGAAPVPATAAAPAVPEPAKEPAKDSAKKEERSGGARTERPPREERRPGSSLGAKGSRREGKGEDAPKREEPPVPSEFAAGAHLGRYTIEEAIGAGGTGTVYRAFDPTTNRYVALKLLAKGLSDGMRQRFLREIEVQANLRHQNLMPVFDRGEHDGRPYFTMELLYRPFTLTEVVSMARDGTISRYATLRPFDAIETLVKDVFIPVCEAIHVANVENGVIHRDLKPDNVLVDSRTLRPYVIDFGICHVLERHGKLSPTVVAPTTEDAGIVGTPRFLAPEQARGTANDRTDVWGLGAVLHYCLSGEPPIAAAAPISRQELDRRVAALREAQTSARTAGDEAKADLCAEKLARLEDVGLRTLDDLFKDARQGIYVSLPASAPAAAAAVAAKAMSPKTADRYVNARSMAADLSAWLEGAQTRAMAERGSSAASVVQGAGRAVKRHLRTAILVLAALALGFFGARTLGSGSGGAGGGALDVVRQDLLEIERKAVEYGKQASLLPAAEAAHAYDGLRDGLAAARKRIDEAGKADGADAARAAAQAAGDRFLSPRVEFRAPAGVASVQLVDLVRGGAPVEVKVGEAVVAPGAYAVTVGAAGRVRLPLRVPFVLRAPAHPADREPAVTVVTVPVAPDAVPNGMVLVVPPAAGVEHRGPPFQAIPSLPVRVPAFLMDRAETTNAEWSAWLEALPDDAREARVPAAGFKPDLQRPGHVRPGDGLDQVPVAGVSPEDAAAYAEWRAKKDGAKVRLPTEAEWATAAGVALGWTLPSDWEAKPSDADFAAPIKPLSQLPERLEPYGVLGLLGNVRELVTAVRTSPGVVEYLAKGAAAGDEPPESAIRKVRPVAKDAKDPKNGVRLVREIEPAK